jgi:UDP-3-O-[3-hydroxymyristoyl] glucosamine N-acyltransferase
MLASCGSKKYFREHPFDLMKLSLEEIVSLTGGKLVRSVDNHADIELIGMTALNEAGPDEVSFLGNEKYYKDYLETNAGVVLVPPGVPGEPAQANLVEVEDPSHAFGKIIEHFTKALSRFTPGVHPAAYVAEDVHFDPAQVSIKAGAVVESGVVIGNGTEIGAGVVVGYGTSIGENCLLHMNCTVRERCILQDRVILQPGCVIGADGYGYSSVDGRHEKIEQVGIVLLENDVEIGANSTIDRARFGKTVIGEGSKIDNQVQVGHNVIMGKHCLIVSQVGISGSTHVGNYVTMGGQAGTAGHLKIADKVVLTGRSGATKNIDKPGVYSGLPARPMREFQKNQVLVARLPKLFAEVKALRSKVDGQGA